MLAEIIKAMRPRLTETLRSLGLLSQGEDVDHKMLADETDFSFGSLVRCSLARGNDAVMQRGLENVLRAAVTHRVSRFVHISSVAVYGSQPPAASVSEAAAAKRSAQPGHAGPHRAGCP